MDCICKYDYINYNCDFSHNVISVVVVETTIGMITDLIKKIIKS